MKLSCIPYHRDLVAYIDGELPPERAASIEKHVRSCSRCAAEARELRELNALAPPGLIEPSPDFDTIFWARLSRESRAKAPSAGESALEAAKAFFTRPAGLSLAVGMAMGVFVVSLYLMRPGSPAGFPPDRQQELMAAADLELYANLEVIENSEALENFELIEMLDGFGQDEQG